MVRNALLLVAVQLQSTPRVFVTVKVVVPPLAGVGRAAVWLTSKPQDGLNEA